jgi:quercetin dioxygenase-like cupin family protein
MTARRMWFTTAMIVAAASGLAFAEQSAVSAAQEKRDRARVAFSHNLPGLNGEKLSVTVVEVNYGPGESSTPHSHPCPVIGYVLEGTLRTQVKGEPEAVYKAGESFYEAPNGVHLVSANASQKEPAKLLAYFVCDSNAPLSVEVPPAKGGAQR